MLTLNRPELDRRIDDAVEAFEQAWARNGRADVSDFLPPGTSSDDRRVAIELLCVDMQYRWQDGDRKTLRQYRQDFPSVLQSPGDLDDLAREEYRLRIARGERTSPETYRQEFQIDTSTWPSPDAVQYDTVAAQALDDTGIDALGGELQRLADTVDVLPVAGDTFGEFELVEPLGRGSFSMVYLARQSTLEQRPVVLKITTASRLEARFLSKLQHTNIVPIYSLHQAGRWQAICMPFFGRQTLAQALAAEVGAAESFDERRAVDIAIQIARGLDHAHGRGIVHRDLKPANVLLADDGTVMVLDFNLSDEVVAGGKSCLMVGGTLPYLAPEHLAAIRTGQRVLPQADIYSLGAILYQMLCGQLPFAARQASFDVAIAQMIDDRQTVPSPRRQNARVSPGLDAIVRRMLAPDPAARYQTMAEVIEDLERHRQDRPLKFAPEPSRRERITKWSRRHPRLSSATSILLASALVVTLLVLALVSRGQRIARQDALARLHDLHRQLPQVRALAGSLTGEDRQTLEAGAALARQAVEAYGVLNSSSSPARAPATLEHLAASDQSQLRADLAQTLYWLAAAQQRLAGAETDAAQRQERWQAALIANQAAIELQPADATSPALAAQHDRLVQAMAADGDDPPASANALDDVLSSAQQPGVALAHVLLVNGQYEAAIEQLEALRGNDPYDVSHWFLLGQAYGALGRLPDAEACFSVCIAMWPESYLGYFHRGRTRLDAERHADAAADFTATLALKADYVPALINRAVARRELAEFEQAEADLTEAIRLRAEPTRVYLLRAEIRNHLGDPAGAATDRQRGLELTPTDEQSWIARGLARLRDDPEQALHDFQMATRFNPRSYAAWRNIAHVFAERLNRPDEAIAVLDQLLEWSDRTAADLVSRGVLQARLGNRDAAYRDARRVLSLSPDAKEQFQVACIYALTSQPDNDDADVALALIEKAVTIEPRWLPVALHDSDLAKLHAHPDFARTMARLEGLVRRERMVMVKLKED